MARISNILVPTDFSEQSDTALDYARTLAAHFGASLHLLHVFEDPFKAAAFQAELYAPVPAGSREAMISDAEEQLEERLLTIEPRECATGEVIEGTSSPTIIEYARARGIDLIVMGTHGRTGMAHLLLGSVAERVLRGAPCPVLTVRQTPATVPDLVPVAVAAIA